LEWAWTLEKGTSLAGILFGMAAALMPCENYQWLPGNLVTCYRRVVPEFI
jgi:hypothetical protein